MKKGLKITVWILALLAVLLLAGLVAIQSPVVQTAVGKRIVERIQKGTDATIRFKDISIRPTEAILLEGLVVLDNKPLIPGMDTILFVDNLSVKFSLRGLINGNGAYVRRLRLSGGGFNLVMEPHPTIPGKSVINLMRAFGKLPAEDKEPEPPHWGKLLTARQVDLENLSFRMENIPAARRKEESGEQTKEGVIDWNHLSILLENAHVDNLKIADNLIIGQNASLRFLERMTGLHFQDVSADSFRVGEGKVEIKDLHAADGFTDANLEHFNMTGTLAEYDDFTDRVVLDGQLRDGSLVDMGRTIRHFAAVESSFRGIVRGKVHGTVNNLFLDNIVADDPDNGLHVYVNGSIRDVEKDVTGIYDITVKEASFDLDGLSGFIRAWAPRTQLDLGKFAPGERMTFEGRVEGPLNDLSVNGQILSEVGTILADVYLKNLVDERNDMRLGGRISTANLHLGKVLGTDALGPLTMRTSVDAVFRDKGGMDVQLDTLQISRLRALDYDYSGISAHGSYKDASLKASLVSQDPNLLLDFGGQLDLGVQKDALYRFTLDLKKADLAALHLDKREVAAVSLQVDSDIRRADAGHLDGQVTVENIALTSQEGTHRLGDMTIQAHQKDSLHHLDLQSEALTLDFTGNRSILRFVQDLQRLFIAGELPALQEKPARPWDGASYQVSAQVLQAQHLITFLVPGLYVENKTSAKMSIAPDGLLQSTITSGRLALGNRFIKDVRIEATNQGSALTAAITGGTLDLGGTQLLGNKINLKADDNQVELGYAFDNQGDGKTFGQLNLKAHLEREDNQLAVKARLQPSVFSFASGAWQLKSEEIEYKGGDFRINGLRALHDNQSLQVDGGVRKNHTDTLRVRMDQFDLSLLNALTNGTPELSGRATGRATLISPTLPAPGLIAGITCDSVYVAGKPMGTLRLVSNYDEQNKRFTATVRNWLDGRSSIDLSAHLVPSSKELGVLAIMDRLDMGYAQPFLSSLFSEFQGSLSGLAHVSGTLDKMHLSSENLRIEDGTLALDFTKVPYAVNGKLELKDEGLFFKPLQLDDREEGSATVEGGILFNNFKKLGLDVHVRFNQMHVMNIPQDPDLAFFGNLYGTGRVDVTGDLNKVLLGIDATTRSGELHVPLGSTGGDSSRDLLTFTEGVPDNIDLYEQMVKGRSQVRKQEMDLNVELRVRATPETKVYIDVDNESSLTGIGQGNIDIVSRSRQGLFTINGDYTLNSGSFHFSAMNLVSRDFTIQDGSSVRFNGDVMNTDLNVNGLYVTKASLYNLTADESATSRRTVNCGISITGKLRNPELHFSIDIPDLNPAVQAQVEGAFNTEDKIQKQFIYLLVAGSFLPSEESGISVGGTDVLFSNVSSIMSGQLNNIFQKLNIPLDLGLNYKSTQTGTNIFDVAVSTQLFNNRVVVNGTVGNREDITGMSTNQVAGDVDIEIKLNRTGSLRLSLFTHSADQLSAYLDNSQRHGGGIAYQMEFNTFRQLFRDLFSKRQTRDRRAQDDARRPVHNVTLQIDENGKAHVQR